MNPATTLLCAALLAISVVALWLEGGHQRGRHFQRFCDDLAEEAAQSCERGEATARCADGIAHLERVELAAVVWRVDVLGAAAVALTVGAAAAAEGGAALLFLVTFMASLAVGRFRRSYEEAHVTTHPREARLRLLRKLQGLPYSRTYHF